MHTTFVMHSYRSIETLGMFLLIAFSIHDKTYWRSNTEELRYEWCRELMSNLVLPDVAFVFFTEQDSRWGDAEKKLLRRTKFSKVLEQKVSKTILYYALYRSGNWNVNAWKLKSSTTIFRDIEKKKMFGRRLENETVFVVLT